MATGRDKNGKRPMLDSIEDGYTRAEYGSQDLCLAICGKGCTIPRLTSWMHTTIPAIFPYFSWHDDHHPNVD